MHDCYGKPSDADEWLGRIAASSLRQQRSRFVQGGRKYQKQNVDLLARDHQRWLITMLSRTARTISPRRMQMSRTRGPALPSAPPKR